MSENIPYLQSELRRSATDLQNLVNQLSREDFERNPNGKWSAGQDLSHVVKTLGIISFGFRVPLVLFSLFFGKANRPSRGYSEFRNRYMEKIALGFKAPSYVLPKTVGYQDREKLTQRLNRLTENFCLKLATFREQDLDQYIAPHPLFGKITIREMIMATWLHQDHHTSLLKKKLGIN